MVASHPTLPMDSVVRVMNLANGKSVQVRIEAFAADQPNEQVRRDLAALSRQ